MIKRFIILVALFFPCTTFSSKWQWIKGGSFNDVSIVSSNEIWLGGELIVRGTKDDNGNWSWMQKGKNITDTEVVHEIDFYDSNHGIILTTNYIFYTSDGLNSWKKYPYPDNFIINKVQMISENVIIAVGSENKYEGQAIIAESIDYGDTWNILYTANSYFGGEFTDVKILDNGVGFAVGTFYDGWGSYGVVYKTDDGWEDTYRVYQNNEHDLWNISIPSENDVFVSGKDAVIHLQKTNNTYYSSNLNLPNDIKVFNIYFSDNATGLIVGYFENQETYENGAIILITTDGGNTFKRFNFSEGKSWIRYLNLIAKAGDDVFVGQTYRSNSAPCLSTIGSENLCYGLIMKGGIDGKKWERVEKLSGYIYSKIIPLSSNNGIQGYLAGTIYPRSPYSFIQRFNNSEIMQPSFIDNKTNLDGYISIDSIDMKDFNNGFAAYGISENSKIQLLKTTDAGNTWIKINIYDLNNIGAIATDFKSQIKIFNNEIWVKFNNGNDILKSYDYGNTWEYFTNGYGFDLDTMQIFNNKRYILSNYSFKVSNDDGNTWNFIQMYSTINNTLEDLSIDGFIGFQFFGETNGIFWDKTNGYFYKTDDGGNTLTQLGKPKENPDPNSSFQFANETYGYISTFDYYSEIGKPSYYEYYFLKTEDGGRNWKKVNDGVSPEGIIKFKLSKNFNGIAYSPSGMILYRDYEISEPIKAYPDYTLDGKVFNENNFSLIPDIKISVESTKNINISPSMNILREDLNKEVNILKYIYIPSMDYWISFPVKKETVSNIKTFNFYSGLDFSNLQGLVFYVYFGYLVDDKIVYNDYQVYVE